MNRYSRSGLLLCLLAMALCSPLRAAEYDAVIQWERKVSLGTPVSGVVQSVDVQIGQVVDKDTVLLSLDQRVFAARLQQQEARQKAMAQQFEEATRELERAQNYFDQDLSSARELELAKISQATAEAEFKHAEADLVQARHDLQYASVRAPFKGVVLARHAEVGQVVVSEENAPALLEFAGVSAVKAVASVSAAGLATLKVGKKASFRYRGKTLRGEIQALGLEPLPSKQGNRYPIHVVVENKGLLIPVGTVVKLQIP